MASLLGPSYLPSNFQPILRGLNSAAAQFGHGGMGEDSVLKLMHNARSTVVLWLSQNWQRVGCQ